MADPTIICVLGMHRSGTSLLARVLNLLGVSLGPDEHLMGSGPENPKGYWENQVLTDLNAAVLDSLGGSWSDPPEFPAGWESSAALSGLRRAARGVVDDDFGSQPLWGWKDPRTCLTLPFWRKLLPPVRYVLCVRNPLDVADSLARRASEPITQAKGLDLWFSYVTASLVHSTGHPRMIVAYEDLMKDPLAEVERLKAFIGPGAHVVGQARAAIRESLDQGLWHQRTSLTNVAEDDRLEFPAKSLYLTLRLAARARSAGDLEFLAPFGQACGQANQSTNFLLALVGQLRRTGERARDRNVRLRGELKLHAARLAEASADRDRLRARLRRREARLSDAREDVERLQADLVKQRSRVDRLRAAAGPQRREAKAVAGQLEQRAAELDAARAELERTEVARERTERELEAVRIELARLWATVEEQSRTLEQQRGEGARLEAVLAERQAQAEDLRRAAAEVESLKGQLAELRKRLVRATAPGATAMPHDGPAGGDLVDHPGDPAEGFRAAVVSAVPAGSIVLVASEGEPDLLRLEPAIGWHFPRSQDGAWSEKHIQDDLALIAHLEALRFAGGRYFLAPPPSIGWLDQHPALARHLDNRYERTPVDPAGGVLHSLDRSRSLVPAPADGSEVEELVARVQATLSRDVAILDWESGRRLGERLTGVAVFTPPGPGPALPYADASVDVVVVPGRDQARLAEARRVASVAVAVVPDQPGDPERLMDPPPRIEWMAGQPSVLGANVSVLVEPGPVFDPRMVVRAVLETLPADFAGEVALLPPSSERGVAEVLGGLGERVRVITPEGDAGFASRVNHAVRSLRGDTVVLVGEGFIPLPGWFQPLVGTFRHHPRAGLATAKVLGPDGGLREAGGTLLPDGMRKRMGRGADPDAPPHNHVKRVDFCAPALLAIPRRALEEAGGLDETFQDPAVILVDYCLRLRERGLEVRVQPRAVTVCISAQDIPETLRGEASDEAAFDRRWGRSGDLVLAASGAGPAPRRARYERGGGG